MKKYETLKNELEKALATEATALEMLKKLDSIAQNEAVICKALDNKMKLCLLYFNELEKALKNAKYRLVLDCNYEATRTDDIVIHRYSYIDTANKRICHLYMHSNFVDICTSSAQHYREKIDTIAQLNDTYNIVVERDKKREAKTSTYKRIAFDDVFNAVKFITMTHEKSLDELKTALEAKQAKTE